MGILRKIIKFIFFNKSIVIFKKGDLNNLDYKIDTIKLNTNKKGVKLL